MLAYLVVVEGGGGGGGRRRLVVLEADVLGGEPGAHLVEAGEAI